MTDLDTFLKMALLAVYDGTEDEEWGPSPEPPTLYWDGANPRFSLWDELLNINPSWTPAQFDRMWDGLSHKGRVNFVKRLISKG